MFRKTYNICGKKAILVCKETYIYVERNSYYDMKKTSKVTKDFIRNFYIIILLIFLFYYNLFK